MRVTGTPSRWNIVSDGIQVLVPPDAGLREGVRPGWDKGPYAFMRRVLASDTGHELYKHRKATVEPVFAQNKFNRGFRRFQRRGRSAVRCPSQQSRNGGRRPVAGDDGSQYFLPCDLRRWPQRERLIRS